MAISMCAYDHTLAHLLAEMERVDLLLRAQVTRARQLNTVDERFQGLYISEQELDQLLARPNGVPSWALGSDEHRARVASGLEALQYNTTTTAEASIRAGRSLRLPRLAALYGLDAFETDCLLVCLATELDLRYERNIRIFRTMSRRRSRASIWFSRCCRHHRTTSSSGASALLTTRPCCGDG